MKVIYNAQKWEEPAVAATVGFFDGVHLGHCYLLGEMRRLATERRLPSAVVTFPVHPRVVLQDGYRPELLNSFDEKLEHLADTGVDYAIVMDFTPQLAALSAAQFINVLSSDWRVKMLAVGYDHRFGSHRAEGYEQYAVYGKTRGMEIVRLQPCGGNAETAVSSSAIRRLIARGEMKAAAASLGYRYHIEGRVAAGRQIGRSLGFPTANIAIGEKFKATPPDGSYAVWVNIEGVRRRGMLYIGSRPTLDNGSDVSVEVNIFDFSDEIYGKNVRIEFAGFIRENRKFDDLDALRLQLQADKQVAIEILQD